jgi:hypothetical protein
VTARQGQRQLTAGGLTISERLVLAHLRDMVRARTGARLDLEHVAACLCLPREVVTASIEALLARQAIHQHADGRIRVVPGAPGGAR